MQTNRTEMEDSLFREKAINKISSPEDLSNYLHVTRPSVWLMLVAVILMLGGMLVWSSVAGIDSFATGTAEVTDGTMHIHFDNEQIAENVVGGMLTEEEALEKALKHVELKKDQLDLVKKVELDYEDGRKVYEVEFIKGGVEYEFDVDAKTGAILDFEKDLDD